MRKTSYIMAYSRPLANELSKPEIPGSGNLESKELRIDAPQCDVCVSNNLAENYCQDCSEYMCQGCSSFHKVQRKTASHTLLPVNQGNIKSRGVQCVKHPQNDINSYCRQCKVVACTVCVRENHESTTSMHGRRVCSLSEAKQEITELYLDKTKSFHGVYNTIKTKQDSFDGDTAVFLSTCDTTEKEIEERRGNVIKLANKMADESLSEIRDRKNTKSAEYKSISEKARSLITECEIMSTPFVMGMDVNSITKQLHLVEEITEKAKNVLSDINSLGAQGKISITGTKESFNVISDMMKTYFQVDYNKPKQILQLPHQPSSQPLNTNSSSNSHKFKMGGVVYLAKRLSRYNFLVNQGSNYDVGIIRNQQGWTASCTAKSLSQYGRSLLSLTDTRHIVISGDSILLCDESARVIQTYRIPQRKQSFTPHLVAYVNKNEFLTLDITTRTIRFHSTSTLEVLHTCQLVDETRRTILWYSPEFVFCTKEGNVVVQTSSSEATMFSRYGAQIKKVPFNSLIFQCNGDTVCCDSDNNILAIKKDGSVLKFTLNGGCTRVGTLQDAKYVFCAGIGDDDDIYASYYAQSDGKEWVARINYVKSV